MTDHPEHLKAGKMRGEISATMAIALRDMYDAPDRELVRYQGGFWAPAGAAWTVSRTIAGSHGTPTIEGLVKRGRAEYTKWKPGKRGPFPIAVRYVDEQAA